MTDKNGLLLANRNFYTTESNLTDFSTRHDIDDHKDHDKDDRNNDSILAPSEEQTDSQLIYYMGIFLSGAVVVFVFVVLIIVVLKNKGRPRTLRNPTLMKVRPTTMFWHNSSYKERSRSGLHKSTLDMFKDYEL